MADSRQFVDILDDHLVKFSKENEIETTAKKAEYDVRIFREYLDTIQERRAITQMPFPDLPKLMQFILAVKRKNGDGEGYEPSSIRVEYYKLFIKKKRKKILLEFAVLHLST